MSNNADPPQNQNSKEYQAMDRYLKLAAHDWIRPINCDGKRFVDEFGRTLQLRGVNISGNSKLPLFPRGCAIHGDPLFFDHTRVSFVGRPFPLDEAGSHFARLRSWGLTFCRLLVPWEALEHQGPGIYDEDYIKYLIKLIQIAQKYGIKFFIDPHQDTWSRFTGGSGAPGWTFEVVGLDITKLEKTGATVYHDFNSKDFEGKMLWPTNYTKAGCATMFTIFFGGDVFAPKSTYKGESCQSFLNRHFCACYEYLARKLKGLHAVFGFEAINEPHPGYIGYHNITAFNPIKDLHLGYSPTALQSWAACSGFEQTVDFYIKSWPWPTRKYGQRVINHEKDVAWLPGRSCVWRENGVWDVINNVPTLLKPDHFSKLSNGDPADFYRDFYVPFLNKFYTAIKKGNPDTFFFFEPVPNEEPPILQGEWQNTVYAPHWYDLKAVFQKYFDGIITHDVQALAKGTKNIFQASYFGLLGAKRNYAHQISNVVKAGLENVGDKPCLIGECGIPMDMNQKKAFISNDYTYHNNFLDAIICALETNMVHFTLWNYNPINNNAIGDCWNGEDFSIYSPKKKTDAVNVIVESVEQAARKDDQKLNDNLSIETKPNNAHPSPFLDAESGNSLYTPTTPFDITDIPDEIPAEQHHVGGRALDAVIRPYAAKICGVPISMNFKLSHKSYELVFYTEKKGGEQSPANASKMSVNSQILDSKCTSDSRLEESLRNTTEIYVPLYHYRDWSNFTVNVSDGNWTFDLQKETIYWTIDPSADVKASHSWITSPHYSNKNIHYLRITRKPTPWW